MIGSSRHLPPPLPFVASVQVTASSFISGPHMKPDSTLHVLEQPSLSNRLPSSQSSPISSAPLPQAVAQACVLPDESRQLGSAVQVFEQPDASPKNNPFGPLQSLPPG